MFAFTIGIIGVGVLAIICRQVFAKRVTEELQRKFEKRDYEGILVELDRRLVKYVIPPFNREYLKMNIFIRNASVKDVTRQIDKTLKAAGSKKQVEDVVDNGFLYFLEKKDLIGAQKMIDEMKTHGDAITLQRAEIMNRAYLLKESTDIDRLKEDLPKNHLFDTVTENHLLSLEYESLGNHELSEEYLTKAKELVSSVGSA